MLVVLALCGKMLIAAQEHSTSGRPLMPMNSPGQCSLTAAESGGQPWKVQLYHILFHGESAQYLV